MARIPRGTRIGTPSTTLIPTLMGTQAIAYLGPPAGVPFALVRWLSGAVQHQVRRRSRSAGHVALVRRLARKRSRLRQCQEA
jgi:hypothetical protein